MVLYNTGDTIVHGDQIGIQNNAPTPSQSPQPKSPGSLTLFYSYAREDELLRDELDKHLSLLKRDRIIDAWCAFSAKRNSVGTVQGIRKAVQEIQRQNLIVKRDTIEIRLSDD